MVVRYIWRKRQRELYFLWKFDEFQRCPSCYTYCGEGLGKTKETGNKRLICKIKRVAYESEAFKWDDCEKEAENV